MKLIYLIGEPGVGKTTAMRELTSRLGPAVETTKPFAHRVGADWMELGRERGTFSGTDALSMSVQPMAIGFLRQAARDNLVRLVLGEGDRLGTGSFLDAVGVFADVRLVGLVAPPEVAAARRELRGSRQAETWLKGRINKVQRLLPRAIRIIDARLSPREIADELSKEINR